jgi:ABC-type dipeptide/oligopeptide/nickel transport system ATPase component
MSGPGDRTMLSVRDLRTHFFTQRGVGRAADGVSFELHRGKRWD